LYNVNTESLWDETQIQAFYRVQEGQTYHKHLSAGGEQSGKAGGATNRKSISLLVTPSFFKIISIN